MPGFDKETLIGEIFAAVLTEEEAGCIEENVGSAVFQELLAASLTDPAFGFDSLIDCLSPEQLDNLTIALLTAEAGGVSAETEHCIRGIYAESTMDDIIYRYFGMVLCFSEEEASAYFGEDDDDNWILPPPTVLRCAEKEVGLRALADAPLMGEENKEANDALDRCVDEYYRQRDAS